MSAQRKHREEPETCEPVSIPGAPRIRAAGAPAAGVRDVQDAYGEAPKLKTPPLNVLQNRSGTDVLVEGERMIWCQGNCEHSLPRRESWLRACPRCGLLCCIPCREQGHGACVP